MSDKPTNKPKLEAASRNRAGAENVESREGFEGVAASAAREKIIGAVDLAESAESTGRVSEIQSITNEKRGGALPVTSSGRSQSTDPEVIRSQLLKNMPSEKVMRRQIQKEIQREIRYLNKRARKLLVTPGSMSFFEMANLMKKIRELRGILVKFVKYSFEGVKTLWLRFVHGLM